MSSIDYKSLAGRMVKTAPDRSKVNVVLPPDVAVVGSEGSTVVPECVSEPLYLSAPMVSVVGSIRVTWCNSVIRSSAVAGPSPTSN